VCRYSERESEIEVGKTDRAMRGELAPGEYSPGKSHCTDHVAAPNTASMFLMRPRS
jgi:hypothetical protein